MYSPRSVSTGADAGRLERVVQADLLGRHRLRLRRELRAAPRGRPRRRTRSPPRPCARSGRWPPRASSAAREPATWPSRSSITSIRIACARSRSSSTSASSSHAATRCVAQPVGRSRRAHPACARRRACRARSRGTARRAGASSAHRRRARARSRGGRPAAARRSPRARPRRCIRQPGIGGHERVRRRARAGELLVGHRDRDLRLADGEGPAEPAAELGRAAAARAPPRALEQAARRVRDAELAQHVAGVVVGEPPALVRAARPDSAASRNADSSQTSNGSTPTSSGR